MIWCQEELSDLAKDLIFSFLICKMEVVKLMDLIGWSEMMYLKSLEYCPEKI